MMAELSLISNRKLTRLRKLKLKKYRQRKQLFLAEGARAVEQIIQNQTIKIKSLYFDEQSNLWKQKPWNSITQTANSAFIATKDFADISDTVNPQGVIAVCHIPEEERLTELVDQPGIIIASDSVQDPGNMGAIIRSASWFGAKGLLSGKGSVDLFHPKVVRATAGATGAVAHNHVELQDSLTFFEKRGWQIILLDAGDDFVPLKKVSHDDKMVIVIGNEAHGIDESMFSPGREKVRIGSTESTEVESLNAAISLSIALYELSLDG